MKLVDNISNTRDNKSYVRHIQGGFFAAAFQNAVLQFILTDLCYIICENRSEIKVLSVVSLLSSSSLSLSLFVFVSQRSSFSLVKYFKQSTNSKAYIETLLRIQLNQN